MKKLVMVFLSLSLMSGTSLVVISKHWFLIWLGLEMSTLSIIPLLKTKGTARSKEATIKYFMIQAFSAALLLKGVLLKLWLSGTWKMKISSHSPLSCAMIMFALLMKLGLAPVHFWYPDTLSGVTFLSGILMASWQKISPMYMLVMMISIMPNEIIMWSGMMSVCVGGWGGLKQMSVRKILAFSSISHLGWIVSSLFFAPEFSLILFIFYLFNKTMVFLLCHNNNLFFISKLNKSKKTPFTATLFLLALLSLGGLPPLGGFMNKLLPTLVFVTNQSKVMIPVFLFSSLISLYFYLRMIFKTSLILFPQNSMSLTLSGTNSSTFINTMISAMFPLMMWGLLLTPLFSAFL